MKYLDFGSLRDKTKVRLFVLKTPFLELQVSEYGGDLVNIFVPGQKGETKNIVLGYDNVETYEDKLSWFGCNIGRNANRICDGHFTLNGTDYQLYKNEEHANLHSCPSPYCKRMWLVKEFTDTSITFSLKSPHLDQGYPGALTMDITYKLLSDNSFSIHYQATPDRDTIINMTNHSFFNLNGEGRGSILEHKLQIFSDYFTPMDRFSIPTGEIRPVKGTPMDFTLPKTIGQDIDSNYEQLQFGNGYDINFCLNNQGKELSKAALLTGDKSGITMLIETDMPGLQLYTGNFLSGEKGHDGKSYGFREAVCLEPQYFPDGINKPNFPSPVCRAFTKYDKTIVYSFFNTGSSH